MPKLCPCKEGGTEVESILEFLFQFSPRVNLCIAFVGIPMAAMMVLGALEEGVRNLRENYKRKRRWCR